MRFIIALKAFFKAFIDPTAGEKFLLGKQVEQKDNSLGLLVKLQQQGRLLDFFQEEISGYQDADIGMCVRKIHQDCNKVLKESVVIASIVNNEEGASYTVEAGYNPENIKVVGSAIGAPPFAGIVRHKGWKATKNQMEIVIQPAEIEVR